MKFIIFNQNWKKCKGYLDFYLENELKWYIIWQNRFFLQITIKRDVVG